MGRAQPSASSRTSAIPSLSLAVPASRFAVGMHFSRVPASASPPLSAQQPRQPLSLLLKFLLSTADSSFPPVSTKAVAAAGIWGFLLQQLQQRN